MKPTILAFLAVSTAAFSLDRPKLQILNAGDKAVEVFWIAPDGKRVPNGKIEPGKDSIIGTSLGHRFVVVDETKETEVVSRVPVQTFRHDPAAKDGVPAFYSQVVHARGYPICASAKVNPYALKEAAYLADLMLAKRPDVREAMIASGTHCFAYETLTVDGRRPILTPMSEVAGRMSVQVGACFLEAHKGGRGILIAGVPGVEPANVLILGCGNVGANAAKMAAGLGANVVVMDTDLERLRRLEEIMPPNVTTLASSSYSLRERLHTADLIVGAVLVSGARAPTLIRREDLRLMHDDGPVIVDVAIDQGGCVETSRATTHAKPTFVVDGVVHYCVANMPGAVPRTATFALTNATKPYVHVLADLGVTAAARHPVLSTAANILAGQVTHSGVATAFGLDHCLASDVVL